MTSVVVVFLEYRYPSTAGFFSTIRWQFPSRPPFREMQAKNKTCGLFSLLERWQMRNGREKTVQAGATRLWNLDEPNATNLCLAGVWHGALWEVAVAQAWEGEGGRMRARKWQQMKLASCGVLFPPVRSNEQSLGTGWGNWSPEGTGSFSSVRCVCHPERHTHAFLWTHTYQDCMNTPTSLKNTHSNKGHAVLGVRCLLLEDSHKV